MALSRVGTEGVSDASIKAADLNADVITGMAAASPAAAADDDVILVYDTSASALKKMTRGNFKSPGVITALNNATANELVTVGSTTTELDAESNLTFNGSTLAVTGAVTVSTTLGVTGVTTLSEDVTFTGAANNVVWDKSDNALEFADSAKANFGAGTDLSIYHDGSHSYITDGGTGNLKITASQLDILGTSETMATFVDDGAVTLYHNNIAKITTTAAGATITGTLLASTDSFNATGNVTMDFTANQNFVLTFTGNVTFANPTTEQYGQSGIICCIQDGTGSRTLALGTDYETPGGAGITLSTAANAVDIIPYFVKASGSIQLGAVQLAFS